MQSSCSIHYQQHQDLTGLEQRIAVACLKQQLHVGYSIHRAVIINDLV